MRHALADVRTYTDILRRHIDCPECGRRVSSMQRRGVKGGALAASAKLRAALSLHIREQHPDTIIARDLSGTRNDG